MSAQSMIIIFLTSLRAIVNASSDGDGDPDNLTPDETSAPDESGHNIDPSEGHLPGGLPMISDSAFSLLILIYVSIAFCFVFFMFCWKTESAENTKKGLQRQCVLMTNNLNEAERKKREAKLGYIPQDDMDMMEDGNSCVGVIPPTPTPPHMSKLEEEDEETSSV